MHLDNLIEDLAGRKMTLRLKEFLLIVLLAFLWSFTFIIVRVCVEVLPPLTFTLYRVCSASIFLIVLSLFLNVKLSTAFPQWKKLFIVSIFLTVIPFTACAYGEVVIDGSTAGIIEGTTPLFTILFAWLFFKQRNISRFQVVAFVIGFIGLMIVFLPSILSGATGRLLGGFYLIIMAMSFAIGFNYSDKYLKTISPVAATAVQMAMSPFIILPFAFILDGPQATLPSLYLLSMLGIIGVSSSLGWVVFFFIIRTTSASNASIATKLCPIITIVWGRLFLGEPVTYNKVIGTAVVLSSLLILTKSCQNFLARLPISIKDRNL